VPEAEAVCPQFLLGTIAGGLLDGVARAPELVGFAEHPAPVTFLPGKFPVSLKLKFR
jgi:hypothetical protein